eukprot:770919-Rhodomonas_salina.1
MSECCSSLESIPIPLYYTPKGAYNCPIAPYARGVALSPALRTPLPRHLGHQVHPVSIGQCLGRCSLVGSRYVSRSGPTLFQTLARDGCTGRSLYDTGVSRVGPGVPPVSSSVSGSVVAAQNEESRQTLISECVECSATSKMDM